MSEKGCTCSKSDPSKPCGCPATIKDKIIGGDSDLDQFSTKNTTTKLHLPKVKGDPFLPGADL